MEDLIKKYSTYKNSDIFIKITYKVINQKPSAIKGFVERFFTHSNIEIIDSESIFKYCKHFENISVTKLAHGDYQAYYYSSITASKLFAIAFEMQKEGI